MENILVVLDGSDKDPLAMEQAVALTGHNQAKLRVLMTVYNQIEEMHKYIGFDNYRDIKQALLDDAEVDHDVALVAARVGAHLGQQLCLALELRRQPLDRARNRCDGAGE
ncbi:MAG: universal stress protein, partial [Porticoccaceae bacterium]